LAEDIGDCILLTVDGYLGQVGERARLEFRGVLWVTDELEVHAAVPITALHAALPLFHDDHLVFLPTDEVLRRFAATRSSTRVSNRLLPLI